jgi:hypothetical protein
MLNLKYKRTNEIGGNIINNEISVLALSNGVILNKDGSVGCGLKIDAAYTPSMSDANLGNLLNCFAGFLNSLPANYDIQVIWSQNSRSKELSTKLNKTKLSDGIIGDVQKEQEDNILSLFDEGELRWINVYFLLIRKISCKKINNLYAIPKKKVISFLQRYFTDLKSTAEERIVNSKNEINEIKTYLDQFSVTLDKLGLNPIKLKNKDINEIFYQRWNPQQFNNGSNPREYKENTLIPFSEYFTTSAFLWDPTNRKFPSGIAEIDGWYHSILTMQEPPEEVKGFILDDLLLLDGIKRCEVIVNVERGNKQERIKRLKSILNQRLSHSTTKEDPSQRTATKEIELELENMGSDSENTWRAATYFHIWADTIDNIKRDTSKIQALARSKDIILIVEKKALWPYWRAIQPFWTQDKDRYRLLDYSTSQLIRLLPIFGQPTNIENKKIGILFQTASRSIFNWLVPDETLFNNPHYLIVGGTGSGKSALAVENLISFQRQLSQIIIIDLGGSFESFCKSGKGIYIDYNIKSKFNRVNPLWLPPGTEPDPEILRSRTLWLESLVAEEGKRISNDDLVILEDALKKAYLVNLNDTVYLRNVRNILLKDTKNEHLSRRLSPWCEDGALANLFDGPTLIDLSAPIVVFDLKRVMYDQQDTTLTRIIVNSIVSAVVSLSLFKTDEAKYLIFDEAGVLLKDEATSEFMEYCFRTLRKTGVCVSAISQALEDFINISKNRNSFIGSADNLFVLKQDNPDKTIIISEEKNLSTKEIFIINSLITKPGEYAEFVLIQQTPFGQRSMHLLSASTPLKYAFTANSHEDRNKIYHLEKNGLSRRNALIEFSRNYPNGVLTSKFTSDNEI